MNREIPPKPCRCGNSCDPPSGLARRDFLKTTGLVLSGLALPSGSIMAGPFAESDFDSLVPADKKLSPEWIASLFSRGAPEVYRGKALEHIGMPVGGIACGQLYLSGDGRLWYWDIFHAATTTDYEGKVWAGLHYETPLAARSRIEQGFALRVTAEGRTTSRFLDSRGFEDVSFRGEYPVARVSYRDEALPVEATLEAFSPFIPLDLESSSLPATVLSFHLRNRSAKPVEVSLAGWLENAVCRDARNAPDLRVQNRLEKAGGRWSIVSEAELVGRTEEPRKDIVFEDFQRATYEGWTVEGSAFGKGPVSRSEVLAYQGDLGGEGDRVVNSHASAPGDTVEARDSQVGRLTSRAFTIARKYLRLWIGGGAQAGKTCLNVVIDGKVVRSTTGRDSNRMEIEQLDLREFQGKEARIEIVDDARGPWGNVGVGKIVFTDEALSSRLEDLPSYGSMALSLLEADGSCSATCDAGEFRSSKDQDAGAIFERLRSGLQEDATKPLGQNLVGALGRTLTLPAGGEATVHFLLTWHFPYLGRVTGEMAAITNIASLRRHYAKRFDGASAVAAYVARDFQRLRGDTLLWNSTWYDSTLPYWFLDRTLVTVDCLATRTLHGFDDGQWWGWEGVDCCPGTCQHVWQYAQSAARLFPALERDFRERVDFGLAWHPNGAMDYRAESSRMVAHDGFCGTILRAYREHTLSVDGAFLGRLWPRIKKSLEYILAEDKDSDGILEGEQMNTLDAAWSGPMAWISSLYLAALAAGEAMALESGDAEFARRCRSVLDAGRRNLVARLYDGEYFIHIPPDFKRTNTNKGCHIDQLMGQSLAFQAGLPRVVGEAEAKSALRSLWKYNFSPDVGVYRKGMQPTLPGGRWYAMPGEAGLLMCTWPKGGADKAAGGGNPNFVGYFNECMTGFEYQVAAHCLWEGLTLEGFAITKAIHERYSAEKRNPYNEVECSDHYSRAMMSHGVYLAASGFEYHGPKGQLAFAPRIPAGEFRAAFTAAEGWGTFSEKRSDKAQEETIAVRWGKLRLASLAFAVERGARIASVEVRLGEKRLAATSASADGRVHVQLAEPVSLAKDEVLTVVLASA